MEDLLKSVDGLPLIVKVIICIFADVFYGVCRIIKGAMKNDVTWIILAVLTVFPGAFFIWILDLIWLLTKGHAILTGEEMFS